MTVERVANPFQKVLFAFRPLLLKKFLCYLFILSVHTLYYLHPIQEILMIMFTVIYYSIDVIFFKHCVAPPFILFFLSCNTFQCSRGLLRYLCTLSDTFWWRSIPKCLLTPEVDLAREMEETQFDCASPVFVVLICYCFSPTPRVSRLFVSCGCLRNYFFL